MRSRRHSGYIERIVINYRNDERKGYKRFIIVRLGTIIIYLVSLPALPTRVSLISDSLPVCTDQRRLEPEWLCVDKISYLWEGAWWRGVDDAEVW